MPPVLSLWALTSLVVGTAVFILSGALQPVALALGASLAVTGAGLDDAAGLPFALVVLATLVLGKRRKAAP